MTYLPSRSERATTRYNLASSKKPRPFVHMISAANSFKCLMSTILLAEMFVSADAMDSTLCCMLRAHKQVEEYRELPWIVCHDFEAQKLKYSDVSDTTDPFYPSVNHTMEWCESNCGGYEVSSVTEWTQPLATWILPTLATALLISVGENSYAKKNQKNTKTGSNQSKGKFSGHAKSRMLRLDHIFDRMKPILGIMLEIPYILLRTPFFTPEFLIMLGDPASAIWGGFSELWMDASTTRKLSEENDPLNRAMVAMVALVGQTRFEADTINESTQRLVLQGLISSVERMLGRLNRTDDSDPTVEDELKALENLRDILSPQKHLDARGRLEWPSGEASPTRENMQKVSRALQKKATLQETLTTLEAALSFKYSGVWDEESRVSFDTPPIRTNSAMKKAVQDVLEILPGIDQSFPNESDFPAQSDFIMKLESGIKTVLKAKLDFISGVLLPVVLTLITTASAFHDAYTNLGDYTSAHNLAFGVWYSWILLLAVVSNSYAASLNAGLTRQTLGDVMKLSEVTVPLRHRHSNSLKWDSWMNEMGFINVESDKYSSKWDWYFRYLVGQIIGWVCVAFSSACAIVISYTTPTVGIGCRSFTFMLYGSISLVLALAMILRTWLRENRAHWKRTRLFFKLFYYLLVTVNLFVIVGGTISHLVGFFHSCRCKRLFAHASSIVQLNTGTRQNHEMAKRFWLPVGWMAFTFVWIVMTFVLGLRAYINVHLRRMFREKDRARTKNL